MKVKIETQRLILRPLIPEDYEACFLWCGDPDVNRYMSYPLYKDAQDVKKWLENRNNDNPDNYDLGFVLKDTNELIGSGGITYQADVDVWEVGYNIRKDMWGNGYVVEAIQALIEYVSKIRKIKVICGVCASENIKSRRVMEKLGMTYYRDTQFEKLDGSQIFKAIELRKVFSI